MGVGSEVAVVFLKTTEEPVAEEVTLGEMAGLIRIFPVGEGKDHLMMEQINKINVATRALVMAE